MQELLARYCAFATFALAIAVLLVFPGMRSRLAASKLFHAGSLSKPANSPEVPQ